MLYEKVKESAEYILGRIEKRPTIGIILGTGLGGLVDAVEEKEVIPYGEIPNFPQSTVVGHAGNLVVGRIGQETVAVMQGRFHYYEGFSLKEVTYPLYVMRMLGIQNLIVTNASGGLNAAYQPGDLALITDHMNFSGLNPLIGPNEEKFGVRFPDMSEAYSKELQEKAKKAAQKLEIDYKEGVYALMTGPSFETAAEIRALSVLGADMVGMSTVPEIIVANYLGMQALGISCITNLATGIAKVKHSHEEVIKIAGVASRKLCGWVEEILKQW